MTLGIALDDWSPEVEEASRKLLGCMDLLNIRDVRPAAQPLVPGTFLGAVT